MNILYGVQTTGNGHINKSRVIVRELKGRGHDVRVIFSGEQQDLEGRVESFRPYRVFKGLTYVTENGKINYIKTAPRLDAFSYVRDILTYDAGDIDLVITDFEPVSVQVAKRNKIPSVGISHQYVFQHDVPYPPLQLMVRTIMEYFVPADFTVPLHWHHFGFPILPPIFAPARIETQSAPVRKYAVVYLPYEDPKKIMEMLRYCPPQFDYYVFTRVREKRKMGNVVLFPRDRQAFLNKLSLAEGAILNAGFTANSEAFDMGVKTLVKPISGQAEQIANAMAVEQLGLGMKMDEFDPDTVKEWLDMPPIRAMHYPDTAKRFADWIEQGIFNTDTLTEMCEEQWSKVPIPRIFRR